MIKKTKCRNCSRLISLITPWFKSDDPAKPCPFCGGKNILEDITQYSQRFLRCDDCGCIGPTLQETDKRGSGPDSDIEWDRLWELWNERD